eukprot:SAG25_NODE_1526_length_2843_cov_2.230685_3_plen_141_part_00
MSEQEQAESVAASFSAQEKRRTRSATNRDCTARCASLLCGDGSEAPVTAVLRSAATIAACVARAKNVCANCASLNALDIGRMSPHRPESKCAPGARPAPSGTARRQAPSFQFWHSGFSHLPWVGHFTPGRRPVDIPFWQI